MGQPDEPKRRVWDKEAERQRKAEQRARKKALDEERRAEAIQGAHLDLIIEEEESKRQFGYSGSETRTKAERDRAAKRMLEAHAPNPEIVVPEDIRKVWGDDPFPALAIERWGLTEFRSSAVHLMAVYEQERQKKLAPLRQAFVKSHV